jgi:glutathione peroxidase
MKEETKKESKKETKKAVNKKEVPKNSDESLLFNESIEIPVHCWDVPISMYLNGSESQTTIRDQMIGMKCVLFVNVASKCGHTKPHYTQMVDLHEKYASKGFQIFAFPCNQFGSQESKPADFVAHWAKSTYQVGFPIFEKIEVNGAKTHPVFKDLKEKVGLQSCKWNFEKFLVNSDGEVKLHGNSKDLKPKDMEADIKKLIKN